MRIAVTIIALFLMLLVGFQSYAVIEYAQDIRDDEMAQAGALGFLVTFCLLLGGAFSIKIPKISVGMFVLAGLIGLFAAENLGFGDMTYWAISSIILAIMSFMGYSNTQKQKECPMCAELVKKKAKICRFCSYEFENEEIKTKYDPSDFDIMDRL